MTVRFCLREPGGDRFNGGVPVSSSTIVIALLIFVLAGAVWAIAPPQVGTLVSSVIAVIAVLYIVVNLAFA